MFYSAQHALDGLSANVKSAHVALLNLNKAIEGQGTYYPEHERVMVNGTLQGEYQHLRFIMQGLEVAMRETMALTETDNTEDKK
jgi:hypothetical protein